jgi:hypothetical protein
MASRSYLEAAGRDLAGAGGWGRLSLSELSRLAQRSHRIRSRMKSMHPEFSSIYLLLRILRPNAGAERDSLRRSPSRQFEVDAA